LVVNQWLQDLPADLRANRALPLFRFRTGCCVKSSVETDLQFMQVNLFDCAAARSSSRTWGGKENCND